MQPIERTWTSPDDRCTIYIGDCLESLKSMPDESVQCVVTSPPYYGLRDYQTAQWLGGNPECDHIVAHHKHGGQRADRDQTSQIVYAADVCPKCGATRKDSQIGLEETPEQYVQKLVEVFRGVRRVLRDDGTLWLNLGDSYATNRNDHKGGGFGGVECSEHSTIVKRGKFCPDGLKMKDLIGIPWRVAFALQADGWWLRQDIIWCISGGAMVYARTQKGDTPMTVKDLYRLDPSTVQLWNGEKWTQLLGMNKSKRRGNELEIVLRSGERISCTPTHKFPTTDGLKDAASLVVGDKLIQCRLPEPDAVKDCAIDEDAAWFAGLYLAEGSRSEDTIQIAGHAKETARLEKVNRIAAKYGGTASHTIDGNTMNIRVYGKVLNAIISELASGRTAKDKGFATAVWRYSDAFVSAMLDGYLSGDGCEDGERWRLGFCRNYNLERDLRTACARLGYTLTLSPSTVKYGNETRATFRGELRKHRSGHGNEKDRCEIMEIRNARCRYVYDLGVEDDPHVFALASGVLTHNSKPNPMPESVTDRCTKAHEYIFLLSKSARYYYDAEAIKEPAVLGEHNGSRSKRSVWTVATKPYSEAHFATFPDDLIKPCILAGTSEKGCCPGCGNPWERVVEKSGRPTLRSGVVNANADRKDNDRPNGKELAMWKAENPDVTTGWQPTCDHAHEPVPCVVLDPFGGSGTTAEVSLRAGRRAVLCELNPEYVELIKKRLAPETNQGRLF